VEVRGTLSGAISGGGAGKLQTQILKRHDYDHVDGVVVVVGLGDVDYGDVDD